MCRPTLTVLVVIAIACTRSTRQELGKFVERGVSVEIALTQDTEGRHWLMGTFTPTISGFHLYGKDLPAIGLDGFGRPTRMELLPSDSILSNGLLEADQTITDLRVPTLGLTFPVYPAGPVTLRQPIRLSRRPAEATVSVTYMACSDDTCLPPVVDRRIPVVIQPAAIGR